MSPSITKIVFKSLTSVVLVLTASGAFAGEKIVLSKVFQVCARSISGLTVDSKQGIDAVEGQAMGNGAIIEFMISTNPNLPAGMNIKQDKNGYILPKLSADVAFIAESTGPLGLGATGHPTGYGTERLYAFSNGVLDTPIGPIQRRIFVQLWSDKRRRNVELLKKVGDSLYRCR
jgi:hypothetical protein